MSYNRNIKPPYSPQFRQQMVENGLPQAESPASWPKNLAAMKPAS